jgi:5-methylcytosine-specific restriction endonuclease McrA
MSSRKMWQSTRRAEKARNRAMNLRLWLEAREREALSCFPSWFRRRMVRFLGGTPLYYWDDPCVWCGRPPTRADRSTEHVIPQSHGGPSIWENKVLACRRCNSKRGSLPLLHHLLLLHQGRTLGTLPSLKDKRLANQLRERIRRLRNAPPSW